MLRLKKFILVAGIAFLVSPAALAEDIKIVGGEFQFLHAPVDPTAPDDVCYDPEGMPSGGLFSVTSDSFTGVLETDSRDLNFQGLGDASGCAYSIPIDGVAAAFSGKFTWQTKGGLLNGSFELLDIPTDYTGVFVAVISIKFHGGTGRFKSATGTAMATGLDFPFGGLGGDLFAAGVVADNLQGVIVLN